MSNVIETAKAAASAYNDKDWGRVEALFAEDGLYDEKATGRRIQGRRPVMEAWQGWATAIPDSKAMFLAEHGSGDTAILEVVWKGTHTGPLQAPSGTIPPSNRPIEVPACLVMTIEGGRVKSYTHYFYMLTLLRQIGAVAG